MKCFRTMAFKSLGFNFRRLFFFSSILLPTFAFADPSNVTTRGPWAGFYVGANVGYAWNQVNDATALHNSWITDGTRDNTFLAPFLNNQLSSEGLTGGVQVGYNTQVNRWVPGIVLGLDYLGAHSKYYSGVVTNTSSSNPYSITSYYTDNWLVTIRPKLGYTEGSFLPYVTGGLAIAQERFSQNLTQHNLDFYENGLITHNDYGWTLGAGTEYALANHWHVMIEYLFVDLPRSSTNSTGMYSGVPYTEYTSTSGIHPYINIVHAGLIYKF